MVICIKLSSLKLGLQVGHSYDYLFIIYSKLSQSLHQKRKRLLHSDLDLDQIQYLSLAPAFGASSSVRRYPLYL